ncbi:MAG: hypothetical protein JEZ11_04030 [Desulfobacterales bacterium]|nr:hypothetical protein [Desulfobacterales bacterium]
MTSAEQAAITSFLQVVKEKPGIKLVSTIEDNPDCGIYVKIPEPRDMACLAVAQTNGNQWFALDLECNFHYFESDEVF